MTTTTARDEDTRTPILIDAAATAVEAMEELASLLRRAGGRDSDNPRIARFCAYHLADLEGNDSGAGWLAGQLLADELRAFGRDLEMAEEEGEPEEETCECGAWPVSEYGPRCPSCPSPAARIEQAIRDSGAERGYGTPGYTHDQIVGLLEIREDGAEYLQDINAGTDSRDVWSQYASDHPELRVHLVDLDPGNPEVGPQPNVILCDCTDGQHYVDPVHGSEVA